MKVTHKGFTLIELLLGLSIFALIAATVYGVFAGGVKLNDRAYEQNTIFRQARLTFDLMTRELENMETYDFSGSYTEKSPFVIDEGRIEFLLSTAEGIKAVRYYLTDPDQVFTTQMGETFTKNQTIVLSDGRDVRVKYLMREEQDFVDFLNDDDSNIEQEIIAMNVKENGLRFQFEMASEEFFSAQMQNEYLLPVQLSVEIDFVSKGKKLNAMSFKREVLRPHKSFKEIKI